MRMSKIKQIILIDNFDSFSYNLVNQLNTADFQVKVFRNKVTIDYLEKILKKSGDDIAFVLSPGPGRPSQAGNLLAIIQHFKGIYPIVGICLGHQAIIESLGGTIGKAPHVVHGKSSQMQTSNHPLFAGLATTETIGRYHSLMATSIPPQIQVLAQVDDIPMVIICEKEKLIGLQFHPESILTLNGSKMLNNALAIFGSTEHA